jgi:PKHD-type hydroxylase
MEKNDKFEFLIYRKNFLSNEECDKIIKSLDTEDLTEGELVGDYEGGTINKNVRKTLNKDIIFDRINKPFDDKALFNKIESALKIANIQYFNYDVEGLDKLRFLKYGIGGRYEWHTDYGRHECSMRKLTGIIQLSDSDEYEGGDFEFGLTDTEGSGLLKGNRDKGCLLVFPSFLSHRVAPLTKGKRYSIITWLEGDTFR